MAIASTFWFNNFASLTRSGQLANFIWSNPSNAQKQDTNYSQATVSVPPGPSSGNAPYPWLAGSGISNTNLIPSAGVIKGLILRIRREATGAIVPTGSVDITDTDIRLFLRDTTWSYLGDNKSTGTSWDTSFAYKSYGGETDTWGYAFTPDIINNSGFGFTFGSNANFNILYDFRNYSKIDNVELTVFWDYPTINPTPIGTGETFGLNTRIRATYSISNAKPIPSIESVPRQRLYSNANSRPVTIASSELVNRATLYASNKINPLTISSSEFINTPKLLQYVKPISISTSETFGSNLTLKAIYSISLSSRSITSQESVLTPSLKAINNIKPITISSQEIYGLLRVSTTAKISPVSISSQETFSIDTVKATNNIRPSGISDSQVVNNLTKVNTGGQISPLTIGSQESTSQHNLKPAYQIRPVSISSQQNVSIVRLTTYKPIYPKTLNSSELVNNLHKFTNKFYDTLDFVNVWTAGDTSSFTWDTTYSINGGGYAIRRTGTSGFRAVAYPLLYDKGPMAFDNSYDFYYAGYVYLTTSDDSAGLGFGLGNNNDVANGYFAVINPRNGTGGASNNSFRLIRVTGGASRTVTTLSSYNLAGLIQANQWYRIIITWSNTLITARLYNKNGTALVNAATLTSNDTTYSSGYYGLTAFNGAVFDVLTNIPARFIDLSNLGISSQQALSVPSLSPGNVNISPNGLGSIENYGNLRLAASYNINPITLPTSENFSISSLTPSNVNIQPVTISSLEFIYEQRLLKTVGPSQEILPKPITSLENINVPTFRPENYNINPLTISTLENVPVPKLRFNISPSGIQTLENYGNLRLTTQYNIYPEPITTTETFGNALELKSIKNIYPVSISSLEAFTIHSVRSANNIYPEAMPSSEIFNIPTLYSIAYIYPRTITSQEVFGNNLRLSYASYEIKPLPFGSFEEFGLHTLNTKAFINPATFGSFEEFGLHTVESQYYIYPLTINSQEAFGNNLKLEYGVSEIRPLAFGNEEQFGLHTLNSIAYINPVTIDSQEIFGLLRVDSGLNIYPRPFGNEEQFGLHTLKPTSYIFPVSINSQEIFGLLRVDSGLNIYPLPFGNEEQFGLHKLNSIAFIYSVEINSQEIFGFLRVDSGLSIYPLPLGNEEQLGFNELIPGPVNIYPIALNSEEVFGGSLKLFAQPAPPAQNIWLNSSNPDLPAYGNLSQEQFGLHILAPTNEIYPATISSLEFINDSHKLFNGNTIFFDENTNIKSKEDFSLFKLVAGEHSIYPLAFSEDGNIGNHKLYVNYNIYPTTFDEFERVGGLRASFYLDSLSEEIVNDIILDLPIDYDPLSDFYLTNDGETLFTWDNEEYIDFEIFVNDDLITVGYSLTPELGLLEFSTPLETGDEVKVNIYRFTKETPHKIFPYAFIYPTSIQSEEKLGSHWLRPTPYPGRIHSWFEIIHNIESFLDFRNKIA